MIRGTFGCLLGLLLGGAASGCGTWDARVSLSEQEAARVSTGRIWVVAYFPFKQFTLAEHLQRWYGWTHAGNVYSLEGIWDPRPALEDALIAGLKKRFEIAAVPLRSLLEPAVFEKVVQESESGFLAGLGSDLGESWMVGQSDAAAAEARGRGGEYLLELWVQLQVVRSSTFSGVHFALRLWSRMIRLDTNQIVWCRPGLTAAAGPAVDDFRQFAANDLSLFKEVFGKAAAPLCESNWPYSFEGLFPERLK